MILDLSQVKQRFEIIGNDPKLNLSLEKAMRVAPTDISVLIIGESGVGKEVFPKIVHQFSRRKHANYIAVNCGAIPEGTIDSELFGHEKGAFTGATQTRKGYFEVADGGTVFLDEVGELPMTTQVRLLRVLENKEFIKVGASKVQRIDIRIVAATNVDMINAVKKGKFREDLFYRLSTVSIGIPPLRERVDDIHLLFKKFALDFSRKYNMPVVRLAADAIDLLEGYHYPGNIRQLRNIVEEISIFEEERHIDVHRLRNYLVAVNTLPALKEQTSKATNSNHAKEIEMMYKALFELRKDLNDLKKLTLDLMQSGEANQVINNNRPIIERIYKQDTGDTRKDAISLPVDTYHHVNEEEASVAEQPTIDLSERLSLQEKEIEMIKKSLERHRNKRKLAAKELGISERTLYRKIKQYDL